MRGRAIMVLCSVLLNCGRRARFADVDPRSGRNSLKLCTTPQRFGLTKHEPSRGIATTVRSQHGLRVPTQQEALSDAALRHREMPIGVATLEVDRNRQTGRNCTPERGKHGLTKYVGFFWGLPA